MRERTVIGRLAIMTMSIGFVLCQTPAFAQDAANPLTQAAKTQFGMIKGNLAKTATKVPEELYSFQATPVVLASGRSLAMSSMPISASAPLPLEKRRRKAGSKKERLRRRTSPKA